MIHGNDIRPTAGNCEAEEAFGGAKVIVPEALPLPVAHIDDADSIRASVDGTFVVVVRIRDDRVHRRVYLTLKAAEAAVRRAQKRGQSAYLVLAELRSLYFVGGGHE